ncbi:hypothetical protein ABZ793_32965, partial [Micromonospora sp. NPDC047465]|uniref:hypothetical protein n=1 Tax=Micromonospora sp. NPDC047465 TaxID=3154813 RepID=UPI0034065261
MTRVLIAVKPGTVTVGGVRRIVRKGVTTAHDGHEIVQRYPHLWAPIRPDYAVDAGEELEDVDAAEDPVRGRLTVLLGLDADASTQEICDVLDEHLAAQLAGGSMPETVDATTLADRAPVLLPVDEDDAGDPATPPADRPSVAGA